MTVFRETTLTHNGKTYVLEPSNKLMRRLDMQMRREGGRGVMAVLQAAGDVNDPPVFELAFLASEFLRAAGCKDVDEDAMYADMIEDFTSNNGAGVSALFEQIAEAITPPTKAAPEGKEPKNEKPTQRKKAAAK